MQVEDFIQALATKGFEINQAQLDQFDRYFTLLVEWNTKVNLTAITHRREVYLKHFYDSMMPLWLVDMADMGTRLCDVGAGAGFPSIPMKIMKPELEVTIIDSLKKRLTFLDHLSQELGLEEVTTVHARAEEAGQDPTYRNQFDLVTARAVAPMNVLAEYCMPLTRKNGYFIALKGLKADQELVEAKSAIATLGGKLEGVYTDQLPGEEGDRTVIVIRQALDTPRKYPRRPGMANKSPLK